MEARENTPEQVATLPAQAQEALADAFERSRHMRLQRQKFAREYLRDYEVGKAAQRAGFNAVYGSTLIRMPDVRAEIERLEAQAIEEVRIRAGVSLERTLREAAKLAFYDVRNLFNEDGSPKPIHELDDATAAAIEGVEVVELWEGRGEERVYKGQVKKYKLASRKGAVDTLLRHLGGFKEDNAQAGEAAGKAAGEALASGIAGLLTTIQAQGSALGVVKRPPPDAEVVDV